ncbi:hypothetical protein OG568_11165 [Streptomyces sp. NBC_01450]|uniref:hypothetical protein n=1 Tax=Streptomyces sp. NBC_01450 TaxID=2903871 RepID=UPI002E2FCC14|nr:hypothetical protein [Streptomyces sp. NBC_01450]
MAIAVPAPAAGQTTGPTVTVVRLKHTGHVVAALTRTGAAPPPVAGQLTGGALPLAVPGATGLVLVPADLLTAEEPGAPPGLLTAPWHWYVDTGDPRAVAPAPPRLVEVSGDIPAVEYDAGSLRITSPDDENAPVLLLVHPPAQWGTGTAAVITLTAHLDGSGTVLMGDGAVGENDHALAFVRGRPVSVYVTGLLN